MLPSWPLIFLQTSGSSTVSVFLLFEFLSIVSVLFTLAHSQLLPQSSHQSSCSAVFDCPNSVSFFGKASQHLPAVGFSLSLRTISSSSLSLSHPHVQFKCVCMNHSLCFMSQISDLVFPVAVSSIFRYSNDPFHPSVYVEISYLHLWCEGSLHHILALLSCKSDASLCVNQQIGRLGSLLQLHPIC